MKIEATNRLTGEVVTYEADTPGHVIQALDEVYAALDTYKLLKSQLNERAAELWRERMNTTEQSTQDKV